MELNKGSKRTRKVINPEGSIVLKRSDEIQLYLEASNLNIKEDKFYQSAKDKLASLIKMAREANQAYVFGLGRFLTDNGLKLSPVVLYSVLSDRHVPINASAIKTFNTPQRIAEAVSLQNLKIVKLNNQFKKKILKKALENMSEFTLRKNKMLKRKVKEKDLIKLLRPKPANAEMAKLYKAIIEDDKLSKMKETETFVRVKSSKEMNTKDKLDYLTNNVDRLPINELIRNLKFISENADFRKDFELKSKVIAKLQNIKDMRFLNVFDLITTVVYVPDFSKALSEVVKKFCDDVKAKFDYNESATVLFDLSGSMEGEGIEKGFKYLVLFANIFGNLKLRCFSEELLKDTYQNVITDINKGNYKIALNKLDTIGGTALLDSLDKLIDEGKTESNIIIISDEVSWLEGDDLSVRIKEISDKLKGKKVILVNPVVYKGTVFRDNIIAFASLTSNVIYNLMIGTKPEAFVKMIKEYK